MIRQLVFAIALVSGCWAFSAKAGSRSVSTSARQRCQRELAPRRSAFFEEERTNRSGESLGGGSYDSTSEGAHFDEGRSGSRSDEIDGVGSELY